MRSPRWWWLSRRTSAKENELIQRSESGSLRIYDSASRSVKPFVPLRPGEVGMYNCGPTVYDRQHIGNLYSYVVADVVRRTFEYFGLRVKQVMNITDVGHIVDDADAGVDKMAVGAQRAGKTPLQIADEYTRLFMEDRHRLNILDPQVIPKATDHIPEMIALIERLIAKGNAYVNYWVHVRFLRVDSEKMAKSKGGFVTLDDVAGWGYDPLAFRLLALGAGYRNGLDFTRDGMNAAQSRLERWRRTIRAAYAATKGRVAEPEGEHAITREFREALADDLNTPRALAAAEKALGLTAGPHRGEEERALWMLFDMDRVLGLSLQSGAAAKNDLSSDERAVFDRREAARTSGDYAKSDALRKELLERFGIQVKDTKDGTRWERVGRKGA